MTDAAQVRAINKVQWILEVEAYLVKKITTKTHARRMVDYAAVSYGPESHGRDWLDRWFFAMIEPQQAAWNVASLFWGWKPTEVHETPEGTEVELPVHGTSAMIRSKGEPGTESWNFSRSI